MNTPRKLALTAETLRALTESEAHHVGGAGLSYNIACRTNEYTMCECTTFSGGRLCDV